MTIELVLTIAFVIVIAPLVLSRWRFSWFLYILAMSSNGLGISVGPGTLRADILALPLLVAVVVANRHGPRTPPAQGWLIGSFLGGWIFIGVWSSVALSPNVVSSLAVAGWTAGAVSALFIMWLCRGQLDELVAIGTRALALISGISIFAWLLSQFGGVASSLVLQEAGGLSRISGFAFEPNLMGALTCLWVALVVYRRRTASKLTLALTTLIGLASILTMTRAAWVALLIVILPPLLSSASRLVKTLTLGLAAVTSILAISGGSVLYVVAPFMERLERLGDLGSGTAAFRMLSWNLAIEDLIGSGNVLFGLGMNSFSQRHERQVELKQIDYLSNAWISQLHDTGILGLFLFSGALVALWLTTKRRTESLPLFLAFAITSTLTSSLWFTFPWLVMGMLDYRQESPRKAPAGQHVLTRGSRQSRVLEGVKA